MKPRAPIKPVRPAPPVPGAVVPMPPRTCDGCGELLNAARPAGADPRPPAAGDVTVCLRCGDAYVIRVDLTLRRLSARELAGPSYRSVLPDVRRAREAIHRNRRAN